MFPENKPKQNFSWEHAFRLKKKGKELEKDKKRDKITKDVEILFKLKKRNGWQCN